ncbi:MAG: hypothetical protein Q8941_21030 [Bacteroidota bacterium]|nr:hypothetical protein [Bacteroidota bacterium]
MKFKAGDCIFFKIASDAFLAGFISSVERGKYEIALSGYDLQIPPVADYFHNCLLFATKYEMGETSLLALDVIVIEPEYMDQSTDSELVTHIEIPGFLSASGFKEISHISELKSYYESGIKLRDKETQDKDNPITEFEIKCFVNINEFLKNIQPRNEFPTVKLYKQTDASIYYWQIYGSSNNPVFLVIHWGKLGENGEFIEIKNRMLSDLKEMYDAQIFGKKVEGYQETEEFQRMILQFQTADGWGGIDDLDFRNEIWEYLDRFLFWTGNGSISGGDIGSGTINLFFETVIPDIAIDTIVHALREKGIERPYLIALENNQTEVPDDGSFGIKVLYPKDYQGSFFY